MRIEEIENDIVNDLAELGDSISQYTYLISCAAYCRPMPQEFKLDEYLVKECQVKTWLYTYHEKDVCYFHADSESLIVKGALALFQEIFNERTTEEIRGFQSRILQTESFVRHFTKEQLAGLHQILGQLRMK